MKRFIICMLCVLGSMASWADDTADAVFVVRADGTEVELKFADSPTVTPQGSDIVISSAATTVTIAQTERFKLKFGKSASAAAAIKADGSYEFTADGIIVRTAPQSEVRVYSIDGKMMAYARCDSDGAATITTSQLPMGVYVLKTKDINFKFTTR